MKRRSGSLHRMTAKARRARELVAELWNVQVAQVRRDRAAIEQMYIDLQRIGYQWISDKQAWVLIAKDVPERSPNLRLSVACDSVDSDEVVYLLRESFAGAGFELARMDLFVDPNILNVTVMEIEVVR